MTPARILVTGATGYLGRHLIARLAERDDYQVTTFGRSASANISGVTVHSGDLLDRGAVARSVHAARPDWVFHLAYLREPKDPDAQAAANLAAFDNLASALAICPAAANKPIRLVMVGSAAEIGPRAAARSPVSESVPCAPASDYGRIKLRLTERALDRASFPNLEVMVGRVFNLIGPGQDGRLVLGSIAEQLREVLRGTRHELRSGPLHARRDFIDARDAAEALELLALHGNAGELYNICAGRSHSIEDLARSLADLASVSVPFAIDPTLSRPGDPPDIFGDPRKLARQTGWRPSIPIERSLADLWHGVREGERERCA